MRPPVAAHCRRPLMKSTRYRHPGDAIRLISSVLLLVASMAVVASAADRLLGPSATFVTGVAPGTAAGRLLVGLIQVVTMVAAVALVIAVLSRRRYRLSRQPGRSSAARRGVDMAVRSPARSNAADRLYDEPASRWVVVRRSLPGPDAACRWGCRDGDGHQMADHGVEASGMDRFGGRRGGAAGLRNDPPRCKSSSRSRSGQLSALDCWSPWALPIADPARRTCSLLCRRVASRRSRSNSRPWQERDTRHFIMSLSGGERRFVKVLGQDRAATLTFSIVPFDTSACGTSATCDPRLRSSKPSSTKRWWGSWRRHAAGRDTTRRGCGRRPGRIGDACDRLRRRPGAGRRGVGAGHRSPRRAIVARGRQTSPGRHRSSVVAHGERRGRGADRGR